MTLVIIHSAGRGRFTTRLAKAPLVSRPTSNPMYASCRALAALGYEGPAQFQHAGSAIIAARVYDIHDAAQLVVNETDQGGLRTVRFRPYSGLDGEQVSVSGPLFSRPNLTGPQQQETAS